MRTLYIVILLLTTAFLHAQNYSTVKNVEESVRKTFMKAEKAFKKGDFKKAKKEYSKTLEKAPELIDAFIRLGTIGLEEKNTEEAIQNFEKAIHLSAAYEPKVSYTLARLYEDQEDYKNALVNYTKFRDNLPVGHKNLNEAYKKIRTARVRDSLMTNKVSFEVKSIGDSINSAAPEYLPVLSADGAEIIFTRVINNQEDFYHAVFDGANFGKAKPLEILNTYQNEGAHCISADGKTIIFTACDRRDGVGSCDLYYSQMYNGNWSKPKNLGATINSESWDSQPTLSADGKNLYFSSKRPGGSGGADIYHSTLVNKRWSSPKVLAGKINTVGNEESPFIHVDSKTLYFRSDYHPGMGSFDIFYSRLENGEWTQPQNLGYPINTKGEEGALTIGTDGRTAFYASDKQIKNDIVLKGNPFGLGKKKNFDIYQFELPESARPIPSTYIKFKVVHGVNKKPLESQLNIKQLKDDKEIYTGTTDEKGEVLTVLTQGENFSLYVEKDGFIFHSENINLTEERSVLEPVIREIELFPIPTKETPKEEIVYDKPIVLHNIFFNTASAELLAESTSEIDKLYDLLNDNLDIKIRIIGHTDNVGKEDYNKILSQNRADAVRSKLVSLGIANNRISTLGQGETMPISTNETEEGRKLNRRTEFVVIKN